MSRVTSEEIEQAYADCDHYVDFARAIEALARERGRQQGLAEALALIEARAKRADDSWERTSDPMDMGIEHGCNECIGLIQEHAAKGAK